MEGKSEDGDGVRARRTAELGTGRGSPPPDTDQRFEEGRVEARGSLGEEFQGKGSANAKALRQAPSSRGTHWVVLRSRGVQGREARATVRKRRKSWC